MLDELIPGQGFLEEGEARECGGTRQTMKRSAQGMLFAAGLLVLFALAWLGVTLNMLPEFMGRHSEAVLLIAAVGFGGLALQFERIYRALSRQLLKELTPRSAGAPRTPHTPASR